MDFDDILNSNAFWVLVLVGYGAFAIMIIVLRSMGQSQIMSLWVKILVAILIPIISAAFSGYAEG